MVSRTWSVRLNTSIGSSAAAAPPRSAVSIGSPNSMIHFDGRGTAPSRPSRGEKGGIGGGRGPERAEGGKKRGEGGVGQPGHPRQRLGVADHRVDLLGPDDRARDDR